jgi:hypothetical protein
MHWLGVTLECMVLVLDWNTDRGVGLELVLHTATRSVEFYSVRQYGVVAISSTVPANEVNHTYLNWARDSISTRSTVLTRYAVKTGAICHWLWVPALSVRVADISQRL